MHEDYSTPIGNQDSTQDLLVDFLAIQATVVSLRASHLRYQNGVALLMQV